MPEYPIPSWIAMGPPPNPAQAYISNLHLGVQIGQQNQRLQQERVLAEQQMQARSAEADRRSTLEEQKIEYDHQLAQAEMGLQQQKLDEAKQANAIKTAQAAREFQAQQAVQQDIASGMDPAQAMFRRAADLGLSAGDIGQLSRTVRMGTASKTPEFADTPHGAFYRTGEMSWKPVPQSVPAGVSNAATDVVDEEGEPTGYVQVQGARGQPKYLRKPTERPPGPPRLDPQTVAAMKINRSQRADLQKTLQNETLFNHYVEEFTKAHPKEKDPVSAARKNLEDQIAKLDEAYKFSAGSAGGGSGGAASGSKRFIFQRGKGIVPVTGGQDEAPPDEEE